eukprot:scaffold9330_cov32-Tisochrysis_lutea.AAC.2
MSADVAQLKTCARSGRSQCERRNRGRVACGGGCVSRGGRTSLANGGLVVDCSRDHRCVVGRMRHGHHLIACTRHRYGRAAGEPVEEVGEIGLALLGPVDWEGQRWSGGSDGRRGGGWLAAEAAHTLTEAGPREAELRKFLLGLALASQLDGAVFGDGPLTIFLRHVPVRCDRAQRREHAAA